MTEYEVPLRRDLTGSAVRFDSVSKAFGATTVLNRLNLSLAPGELVTLLGPSGCGKTTSLRILAGFERPTAGRVLINGKDISEVPTNKRDVGMVFQAYSLFPNLDVSGNIEYGLKLRKMAAPQRRQRINELLEMCGLTELAARRPHELSGGQQQRVALARALAPEPTVLLLDEPLSALDATVRGQIRDEIRRLQRKLNITTLFVTHDQSEALSVADRVAVMNAGVIEQIGPPEEIYGQPLTSFVAKFVGHVNEFGVESGRSDVLHPLAPNPANDIIYVRPENLTFIIDPLGNYRVSNHIYTGERTMIRAVAYGGRPPLLASATWNEAVALPPGTPVQPKLTGEAALIVPRIPATSLSPTSA